MIRNGWGKLALYVTHLLVQFAWTNCPAAVVQARVAFYHQAGLGRRLA